MGKVPRAPAREAGLLQVDVRLRRPGSLRGAAPSTYEREIVTPPAPSRDSTSSPAASTGTSDPELFQASGFLVRTQTTHLRVGDIERLDVLVCDQRIDVAQASVAVEHQRGQRYVGNRLDRVDIALSHAERPERGEALQSVEGSQRVERGLCALTISVVIEHVGVPPELSAALQSFGAELFALEFGEVLPPAAQSLDLVQGLGQFICELEGGGEWVCG